MKIAVALILVLFIVSIGALMFHDNLYNVLGTTDQAQLAETIRQIYDTDGVVPVLQGLLIVSGLGLAIVGVSYAGRS